MASSKSMDCFCGCGTRVPRRLIDANLEAGRVALELLAWDKARSTSRLDRPDSETIDLLVAEGATRYRDLLSALHGEPDAYSARATQDWLADSIRARRDRRDMTERGSFLSAAKLTLTEQDLAQLDRGQPELSFSAVRSAGPSGPDRGGADPDRASDDPVAQLAGLRELHAAGALTDEEFAAAKARVIAQL